MKIEQILFVAVLLCYSSSVFSQNPENNPATSYKKNQIGIQLNPFIDQQFFDFSGYMRTVAALRYGYRITRNVTTGMEFDCSFPININSDHNFHYFNYFSYRISLYTRYSIFSQKRVQIFAEASPHFSHYRSEWTSTNDHSPYIIQKFGYYVAPGVTLFSKGRRISFDLYYKFSNLMFMNGNKSVLSYKVNYSF